MQQTVLILGASGKIGSRAADAFWDAGWEVWNSSFLTVSADDVRPGRRSSQCEVTVGQH